MNHLLADQGLQASLEPLPPGSWPPRAAVSEGGAEVWSSRRKGGVAPYRGASIAPPFGKPQLQRQPQDPCLEVQEDTGSKGEGRAMQKEKGGRGAKEAEWTEQGGEGGDGKEGA